MAICIMENVEFGATPQLTHGLDMSAVAGDAPVSARLIPAERKKLLLGT